MGATVVMAAAGTAGAAVALRRGDPPAVPLTLGYFALMEALQFGGYAVVDRCGTPANETITWLSMLHIVFQPFVINAFAMTLVVRPIPAATRALVWGGCAASAVVMLTQLQPFAWAGSCAPGAILCGPALCTVSGDWHIAWDVPYNGLLNGVDTGLGWGFPTYMIAAFALPLLYGAWRFVLLHAAVGPILAGQLTSNPNEVPAIWCLFSICILLIALVPAFRRPFALRQAPA
jgi:hypothetical protein